MMISVEAARKLIDDHSRVLSPVSNKLSQSLGYVLAEDVKAPINMPPFRQSAMDGYAVATSNGCQTFKVVGEIKAGDSSTVALCEGEAVRVFTGAMVPESATSVIMQEVTTTDNEWLKVNGPIRSDSHIRPVGEQIKKGAIALGKSILLNPAGIGFLSGLGITEVKVYPKAKVGLVVTGSELVQPGQKLKPGQIYESNSATLMAALESTGFRAQRVAVVEDDLDKTINAIQSMAQEVDLLILSGGISVGDYDFVGTALESLGVKSIFYKVNQKPGKPIFFGKNAGCLFFALPGNPSAALTCYYNYVLPALRKMSGAQPYGLEKRLLPAKNDYIKTGDRAHFLKAIARGNEVVFLEGQSSAMLHTFATANALAYLPAEQGTVEPGEIVEVYLLPD